MVGVFFVFRPKGDVEVAIMLQPLGHYCPCVDFAGRGAITTGGRFLDNDVDPLFNQPLWTSKTEEGLSYDDGRYGVRHRWRKPRVGQHPPVTVRGKCRRDNLLRLGKGVRSPEMLCIGIAWRALLRHELSF
ncbi:hypothetical protein BHM03_00047956 [Ensete ventricosum]|nr:hypothetical protein BHM03_00047956 [Ensete ventricosum]